MLVRNKKPFSIGAVFAISFLAVLFMIFSPVFRGKNGLQFADDSFNRLSKGSSYFIPKVSKNNEKFMGRMFSVSIKADKPDDKPGDAEKRAEMIAKIFTTSGAKAAVKGTELAIEGDLGKTLAAALKDSETMFRNDGQQIKALYGYEDEKKTFKQWWNALERINKKFMVEKKLEESKIVSDVMKKAIEPAYNFYKVDGQKVVEHAGMLSGLLVFYVAYTLWWGYAIFYLFDGLGLTMKKAKVKKEA